MQDTLQDLLRKEMSRKEFMAILGFGVASVFGLSTLLRLLGHKSPVHVAQMGYGANVYGGYKH